MARQRMIKPEFFSSETVTECSFAARLCFVGLWCCADDKGHLKFAPKSLRKELFGLDDVSMEDFLGYLVELEEVRCIRLYVVRDDVYIDIPNFKVYQTINRPTKTNIPEPEHGTHVLLSECSVSAHPKELTKELISKARGGDADAPPAPFGDTGDWKTDYLKSFRRKDDEVLEELPVLRGSC